MSEEIINSLTGEALTASELDNIAHLANMQWNMEAQLANMELQMEELKKKLHHHSFVVLPEAMRAVGISSITTFAGVKINIEEVISAKIPDEKAAAAFKWLEDHGHGAIIKTRFNFNFAKGSSEEKEAFKKLLAQMPKLQYDKKDEVHWQTLRSFCKEMVQSGDEFPRDLFGVFVGARTKIVSKN